MTPREKLIDSCAMTLYRAKLSPEEWGTFIFLLGGRSAVDLADAFEREQKLINQHRRSDA